MFKYQLTTLVAMIGMSGLTIVGPARAAIIEADSSTNTSEFAFDSFTISNDLINTGQPSLASASQDIAARAGSIAASNDGVTPVVFPINSEWVFDDTTFTYQLNTNPLTGGNATGYDITAVQVIKGWSTPFTFSWQNWDLQLATLRSPTLFTTVWSSAVLHPANVQATMIALSGSIGTHVTGIRFVFKDAGSSSVLHEIDVVGTASPLPEPASLGLLSVGGLLLLRKRSADRR